MSNLSSVIQAHLKKKSDVYSKHKFVIEAFFTDLKKLLTETID